MRVSASLKYRSKAAQWFFYYKKKWRREVCLTKIQAIDYELFFNFCWILTHILPHIEITTLDLFWSLHFLGICAHALIDARIQRDFRALLASCLLAPEPIGVQIIHKNY